MKPAYLNLLADKLIHEGRIIAVVDPKVLVGAKVLEELLPEDRSAWSLKAVREGLSYPVEDEGNAGHEGWAKETKVALLAGNDGRSIVGHRVGRSVADSHARRKEDQFGGHLKGVGEGQETIVDVIRSIVDNVFVEEGNQSSNGAHKVAVSLDDAW